MQSAAGVELVDHVAYTQLARDEGTYFMPIFHLFCSEDLSRCGASVPGSGADTTTTMAFHDEQHLSSAGALHLWPFLCDFFASNGLLGEGV